MSPSSLNQRVDMADALPALPRQQGRILVVLLFMGWTAFSVFIYSRFSGLGDSEAYLTGFYAGHTQARTLMVQQIAMSLQSVLGVPFLVHLVFSMFCASGVLYIISQGRPHGRALWLLLAMMVMPNFGVWASVIGRESLFVGLLAYTMGATLGYYRKRGLHRLVIAFIGVAGMIFIRAPYGAGMLLFVCMFILYTSAPRTRLGLGTQALLMAIVGAIALLGTWPYIESYINVEVLPEARSYFTITSDTTRMWVNVNDARQLLSGLWWEIPLALVGPTPIEALRRPNMLPFLASGIAIMGLLAYSIMLSFSRQSVGDVRKILLVAWLPATLIIIITFVPFGIYNPGSAIRYASSFLLFLVYPPLLLCTAGMQPERGRRQPKSAPMDPA